MSNRTAVGNPEISVILPVYNCETYVSLAIESILQQSFTNFELIILNDGSTDDSLSIINRYLSDQRVRVISQENMGLVDTLNKGFSLARGRLIARMDADDVSHRERFIRQYEYLKNNADVALVGTSFNLIREDGSFIREVIHPCGKRLDSAMLEGNFMAHPSAMFVKSVIDEVGGYRHSFLQAEDYDLWLRIKSAGYGIDNIPKTLLDYRQTASGISFSNRRTQDVVARIVRLAYGMRVKTGRDPFDREEPVNLMDLKKNIGKYISNFEFAKWELLWHGCYAINEGNIDTVKVAYKSIKPELTSYSSSNFYINIAYYYLLKRDYGALAFNLIKSFFINPIFFSKFSVVFFNTYIQNKWNKKN